MKDLKQMPSKAWGSIRAFIQSLPAKARGFWERSTGEPIRRRDKVVGIILIVVFLFAFYISLDANKYRAQVRVIEGEGQVGVNPTTESLDFGDLSRGTQAVRRVDIANGTPIPMYIAIFKFGSIGDLVKIDKNFFTLGGNESTKIEFTTYMPASADLDRTYSGRILLFKIPTFGLF